VPADALTFAASRVLAAASPAEKCRLARDLAAAWRSGEIVEIGTPDAVARPARPDRPELRPPREMRRRGRAASQRGRIALLHALAHIELNAIDLAADLLARFASEALPDRFFADWTMVAAEEARHFELLSERLAALGAAYGDLPAHDGLWEAAERTADDLLARLAVVPLVLEARALDVTPETVANLRRAGDETSATVLEALLADEIRHVAVGVRWFEFVCAARGLAPVATYHALVRRHFAAGLRPPFNAGARAAAGFGAEFDAPMGRAPH
jgi:uncharacterized ferritin-like protein (DUF455 family)